MIHDDSFLAEQSAAVEAAIGLPGGFMWQLSQEQDWAFIIKAHALLEAAVVHLLTTVIGVDGLVNVLRKLPLNNPGTGKIAFARSLKLYSAEELTFISAVSRIRNRAVHHVEDVGLRLPDLVRRLPAPDQRRLPADLTYFSEPGASRESWEAVALVNPKKAIWAGTFLLVALSTIKAERAISRREFQEKQVQLLDQLLVALRPPPEGAV